MTKLLVLGAGGHGKVVAETAQIMNKWSEIAFLDDRDCINNVIGIPVIGKLNDYLTLSGEYDYAFVAFGDNKLRLNWIEKLEQAGFLVPSLIHPSSIISKTANISCGTIILAGTIINSSASIGVGCIINTAASLDHDSIIENGVHISPGVSIGGTVRIGSYTWVCIGANISNNIKIGCDSIIAAGATVIKDVPSDVMVAGVPAEIKKSLR